MSRIGRKPITVPSGVDVVVDGGVVKVKGPKGSLSRKIAHGVSFEREGDVLRVVRANNSGPARSAHGLMRALVANACVVGRLGCGARRHRLVGATRHQQSEHEGGDSHGGMLPGGLVSYRRRGR